MIGNGLNDKTSTSRYHCLSILEYFTNIGSITKICACFFFPPFYSFYTVRNICFHAYHILYNWQHLKLSLNFESFYTTAHMPVVDAFFFFYIRLKFNESWNLLYSLLIRIINKFLLKYFSNIIHNISWNINCVIQFRFNTDIN